eukprot:UN01103
MTMPRYLVSALFWNSYLYCMASYLFLMSCCSHNCCSIMSTVSFIDSLSESISKLSLFELSEVDLSSCSFGIKKHVFYSFFGVFLKMLLLSIEVLLLVMSSNDLIEILLLPIWVLFGTIC